MNAAAVNPNELPKAGKKTEEQWKDDIRLSAIIVFGSMWAVDQLDKVRGVKPILSDWVAQATDHGSYAPAMTVFSLVVSPLLYRGGKQVLRHIRSRLNKPTAP